MYLTQPRTAILFDKDMNSSMTDLTTKQQILRRDVARDRVYIIIYGLIPVII